VKSFAGVCLLICGLLITTTIGESAVKGNNPVLLPVKNDPTYCFRIWFKVGSQNDPAGMEGLANLTAQMIVDASTQKHKYEQIIDLLYPLAASYEATVSAEMSVVYGRVHRDNLNDYYPLLLEAILSPAFLQEDLDRIKSNTLNYLQNTLRFSSDEELGKAVLYTDIFSGTPYGHIAEGTVEGLNRITLDDVKKFYAAHYTRDNVVIGLAGGFDEALVGRLRADLMRLPAGKPRSVPAPVPAALKGFKVTLVEKDAPATAISMGFPLDVVRGTTDWYALAIANSWFGEHRNSSSHLYQVIRETRGLNYGDYSYIENFPQGGMRSHPPQNVCRRKQIFEIWIRPVPREAGQFALRAALRELKHLVEHGLTKDEFDLTRNFLKKYILHYAPTTMERLGYAMDDRFYGISRGHLTTFRTMLGKLTRADVNAAIKRHLQFGNMQIAIVTGEAAAMGEELLRDAPTPITYKSPKPDNVVAEDREISVFPVKVAAENLRIVPVAEVFK
jgi:zinc protease